MGLLDDAIRDHLELKRRHGADPGEVARLEHEALGPARREPAAAVPVADQEPVDDQPVLYDFEEDDEVIADERLDVRPAPAAPSAEPVADVEQPTQGYSLEELEAAGEEEDEPAGAAEDERVAPDAEPGADDVLEETPEFLQETPEHDRLWFEQKPPRDFDF
jgi:hypothetical protein